MGRLIAYYNQDGQIVRTEEIKSFKGKDRDYLLNVFATEPDLAYLETNVRRKTAGDIYAGRIGQEI